MAERIRDLGENVDIELVVVRTTGDRVADVPISRIGGFGLFTKEVDQALLDGRADAAVHSLKDLPTTPSDDLALAAVLEREDARDALVPAPGMPARLDDLPAGARVGTSSLRRRALLAARRPDLEVEELRGNLDTRLAALRAGVCDAAILAVAGIRRVGREDRIGETLDPPEWLPAAGQGAIAVVTRVDSSAIRSLLSRLDHDGTRVETTAERAMLHHLQGGCQIPVGALATIAGRTLTLFGFIGSVDGGRQVRGTLTGKPAEAAALGAALAVRLEAEGGREIIAELRRAADGGLPAATPP